MLYDLLDMGLFLLLNCLIFWIVDENVWFLFGINMGEDNGDVVKMVDFRWLVCIFYVVLGVIFILYESGFVIIVMILGIYFFFSFL